MHSELIVPWHLLDDQSRKALEDELERELGSEHPLYQIELTAFARSRASDDVLFQENSTDHYYLVHLTWNQNSDDKYPSFSAFATLEDFIRYCKDTFQFAED